jgi:hypothetical protein
LPDRSITLKAGEPAVTLNGAPGEIILWTSGRTAVKVEVTGDDQAVASLMELSRGM